MKKFSFPRITWCITVHFLGHSLLRSSCQSCTPRVSSVLSQMKMTSRQLLTVTSSTPSRLRPSIIVEALHCTQVTMATEHPSSWNRTSWRFCSFLIFSSSTSTWLTFIARLKLTLIFYFSHSVSSYVSLTTVFVTGRHFTLVNRRPVSAVCFVFPHSVCFFMHDGTQTN